MFLNSNFDHQMNRFEVSFRQFFNTFSSNRKTFFIFFHASGAAPIRVDTLEYFGSLGLDIHELYGMSAPGLHGICMAFGVQSDSKCDRKVTAALQSPHLLAMHGALAAFRFLGWRSRFSRWKTQRSFTMTE